MSNDDFLTGFFGQEDDSEGKLVQTLLNGGSEPFMRPLSDQEQEELSLRVPDMTEREAIAATAEVKTHIKKAWRIIRDIHDRKGWKAMRFSSFDAYSKKHFGEGAKEILEHACAEEAREKLVDTLIETGEISPVLRTQVEKMPESHLLEIAKLPEEKRPEAITLAKQIRAEKPIPGGEAGKYWRSDKLTAVDLKEAVQRLKGASDGTETDDKHSDDDFPPAPVVSSRKPYTEAKKPAYVEAYQPQASSEVEDEPQAVTRFCQFVRAEKADAGIVLVTFYDPDSDTTGQVPVRRDCLP